MRALYVTEDDVIEGDLMYIMGESGMFLSFDTAWRHRNPRFSFYFENPQILKIVSSIVVVSDEVRYEFIPVGDAGDHCDVSKTWCKTPQCDIDWKDISISEHDWLMACNDALPTNNT